MNVPRIPQTDSIQELAKFWDTHDLTDFEDELEEVTEPVFVRDTVTNVRLQATELEAVKEIAESKGIGYAELIRTWIIEKIHVS